MITWNYGLFVCRTACVAAIASYTGAYANQFKPKYLDGLQLSGSSGQISRKSGTYNVDVAKDAADEVANLRALLPRTRKDGKYYSAQRPITKRFVVTRAAPVPRDPAILEDPPRPTWPSKVLKGRFEPNGKAGVFDSALPMELDEAATESPSKKKKSKDAIEGDVISSPEVKKKKHKEDSPEKSPKKRKAAVDDGEETPKRTKKVKVTA